MSKLDDFLGLSDVSEIKEDITINVNGKELQLTIRPITASEHREFQRRCNVIKGNKVTFDEGKYNTLTLTNCIVEPNFSDVNFLNKAKVSTAGEFFNKKFPSGVITNIAQQIQKLSGFESFELEVESAKN